MPIESWLPSTQGTAVIIEDDLDIRNLICAVLRQAGYDVHPAATGMTGVELVRSTKATVVTIDIGLPDIDSYEVLRRIRDFSDCHVLVVSSRTAPSDIATALHWGADDHLSKPFRPRELSARIDAVSRRLAQGTAQTTPGCSHDTTSARSVVRRSIRPSTEVHRSPAFLPAPAPNRLHAMSTNIG